MKNFYEAWWKKLESKIFEIVPVVVGNKNEDPVTLTSNSWVGEGSVNTQWAVAQAAGNPQGGVWNILVESSGKYRVELSRWPFHLQRTLTAAGPSTAIGGTKIREGKSLPIAYGCLSVNHTKPIVAKSNINAVSIVTEVYLKKGFNELQAWFKDQYNKDLCGSYYVRIQRLP